MKNQEKNKKSWAKPEVVVLSVKKETASGSAAKNSETTKFFIKTGAS